MVKELEQYITTLDDADKRIINQRVAEKGISEYLSQQLVYLDCSRVIKGMRMMQTIGYPYQREISSYLYVLDEYLGSDPREEDKYDYWSVALMDRHHANLKYEETNPPVWYGGKKSKDKWDKEHSKTKTPRRKKVSEGTFPGMGKELSAAQTLKAKLAGCSGLKFTLKPPKKDD